MFARLAEPTVLRYPQGGAVLPLVPHVNLRGDPGRNLQHEARRLALFQMNNSATLNGGAGMMEGKVVLVMDVPWELDGLLPEFVSLTDAEALPVLHLIAAILQARETEDPEQ